jgi:hypothetical protein
MRNERQALTQLVFPPCHADVTGISGIQTSAELLLRQQSARLDGCIKLANLVRLTVLLASPPQRGVVSEKFELLS